MIGAMLDLLVVAGVISLGRLVRLRRRIAAVDGLLAASALMSMLVARVFLSRLLGMNLFGLMRAAWLDMVVVAPILGCAVWAYHWWRRKGTTVPARAMASLAVAMAPLGLYASFIEPFWTEYRVLDVPLGGALSPPIRIAVLSDIQTDGISDHQRRAFDWVMSQSPDLILMPGDFFQADDQRLQACIDEYRSLLSSLSAPAGVFAVKGNTDRDDQLRRLLDGTGVRLLNNEAVEIEHAGQRILLAGCEDNFRSAAARDAIRRIGELRDSAALTILLTHRPDPALLFPPGRGPHLIVAGHTHGGQVALPGLGPLLKLSDVPRERASGLTCRDGTCLYVSRGLGHEMGQAPRIRLLCRPEIAVLRVGF